MKSNYMREYLQAFNKTSNKLGLPTDSDSRKPKSYNITTTTAGGNVAVNAKTEYLNERMANSYIELKQFDRGAGARRLDNIKEHANRAASSRSGKSSGGWPFLGETIGKYAESVEVYKEGSDFKLFKGDKVVTEDPATSEYLQYYQRTSDIINKFEINEFPDNRKDKLKSDKKKSKVDRISKESEQYDKELKEVPKTFLSSLKVVSKFPIPSELDHVTEVNQKKKEADLSEVNIKQFYKDLHKTRALTPDIARKVEGKKSVLKSDRDFSKDLSEHTKRQMSSIKRDLNQAEFQRNIKLRDFYQNIEKTQKQAEKPNSLMPSRDILIYNEESTYHDHDCIEKENEKPPNIHKPQATPRKNLVKTKDSGPAGGILKGTYSPGPKQNHKTPTIDNSGPSFNKVHETNKNQVKRAKPVADLNKTTDQSQSSPVNYQISDIRPSVKDSLQKPFVMPEVQDSNARITSNSTISIKNKKNVVYQEPHQPVQHAIHLPTLESLIVSSESMPSFSAILQRHYEMRTVGSDYNAHLELSKGDTIYRSWANSRSNSLKRNRRTKDSNHNITSKPKKSSPTKTKGRNEYESPNRVTSQTAHPLNGEIQQKILYYLDIHGSLPQEASILNPFLSKSRSDLLPVKIMKMLDLLSNFIETSVQKHHVIELSRSISQASSSYPSINQAMTRAYYTMLGVGNDKGYRRWLLGKISAWISELEHECQQQRIGQSSKGSRRPSPDKYQHSSGKKSRVHFSPMASRRMMETGRTEDFELFDNKVAESEDSYSDENDPDWRPEGCIPQSGNIGAAPFFQVGECHPIQCYKEGYNMRPVASAVLQFERKVSLLMIIGGSKIALAFDSIKALYFCELKNFQEIKSIEFPTQVTYISEIKLETVSQSLPLSARVVSGERYLQKYISACELSGTVSIISVFKLAIVCRIDAHVRPLIACFSSCFGKCLVTADSSILRLWQIANLSTPTLAQSVSLLTLTSAVNDSDATVSVVHAGIKSFAVYSSVGVIVLRCVDSLVDVCSLESLMYVKVHEKITGVTASDGCLMLKLVSCMLEVDIYSESIMPIYKSKNIYGGLLIRTRFKNSKIVRTFLANNDKNKTIDHDVNDEEKNESSERKLANRFGTYGVLEIGRDGDINQIHNDEDQYSKVDCFSPQVLFTGIDNDYLIIAASKNNILISYQVPPHMIDT